MIAACAVGWVVVEANTQTPRASPASTNTRASGFTQPADVDAVQTRRPQKTMPNAPSDQPTLALVSQGGASVPESMAELERTAASVEYVSSEMSGVRCRTRVDRGASV